MAKRYFDEGAAAYLRDDYRESIKLFSKALKRDRKFALVYSSRGMSYLKLNQYKKAISDFSRAIRLNPNYAIAYYMRGLAYEKMENFAPAFRDFDQAIEIDPDLVAAYRSRDSIIDNSPDNQLKMEDTEIADHLAAMRVAQFTGEKRLPRSEF
jgi:tetratricopeptide (TPR) repeat protein